ncbi:YscQ/HrcQ family type III secretion apparatus protein [Paraburkholderia sp. Tr-20389]|uniref:type III secretion system cytoplasmic ring protein SctQ n=1 Tax=Paraburkholderia sp. Tr-20389 TaxID=2703903 RepID=UPI00197DED40|nr:type III secretion system cytoplasmic ring protein SctQ [Paraburkholderia sp. Tr-20389]MBN3753600.1 YscQ/HrcQ family type III secretion apparatus protein [Paraburkholderia sp. Tr-20389]
MTDDPHRHDADRVTPLDVSPFLPRLSPAAARGLTNAYAASAPLAICLAKQAYEITWRADAAPFADANGYRFVVGPAQGTVWIDPSAEAEWLGDAAAPGVPAVLRAALLADLCAPLTKALQTLTRQRVELLPPASGQPADSSIAALHFELRRTDDGWLCHGALLFDVPDALDVFFARPPSSAATPRDTLASRFAALPVPLTFELGRTTLMAHELADVESGDIIAIEHWHTQGQNLLCAAHLPSRPAWEVLGKPSGNRIVVERIREMPLEPTSSQDAARAHTTASQDSSAQPAATTAQPPQSTRQFEGLSIELTFQLPSCTMTLGELGTLQPGAVIELEQGINQSVIRIVANGTQIGAGHLIAVGQKLGVRVTALTPPVAQPPRERQDG